jgi:D-alanyl-lipoteichoic acid acyltransferase DltB (MBOAT superfamily)
MDIASFFFLIFLAVLAVAFQLIPGKAPRQGLLLAANAAFLLPFVNNWQSWAGLAVLVLGGFMMVRLVQAQLRGWWLALFIGGLVAAFLYVKSYDFLSLALPERLLDHPIALIGISYMLFKLIHLLVDGWQRELVPVRLLTYANYQLGFFTLLAGPIQRYNDFASFWEGMGSILPERREVLLAWSRILTGMIKMALVGGVALMVYNRASTMALNADSALMALAAFAAMFYAYPAFVFFNFAGYTDIVIGSGRLFGLELPENFNRPYLARNMVDFWNRWHITLSTWIRDYVFMASYKWTAARWGSYARRLGYLLAFVSLFLAGIWHGSSWNFVLFGLVHGIGVAGTQIYGQTLRSAIGPAGVRSYLQNRWITAMAVLVTFHYVCFGFLFFAPGLGRTRNIIMNVLSTLVGRGAG